MDILVIMCIGILLGATIFPKRYKRGNEKLQVVCTVLLIFSMGVMLGSNPDFFEELATLGGTSFLYFLFPTMLSTIIVYLLTKKFLQQKKES